MLHQRIAEPCELFSQGRSDQFDPFARDRFDVRMGADIADRPGTGEVALAKNDLRAAALPSASRAEDQCAEPGGDLDGMDSADRVC